MPATRRALKAFDMVVDMAPSNPLSVAARLAQFTAQSRLRAAEAPTPVARSIPHGAGHDQRVHHLQQQPGTMPTMK
ncbi:hypothetical protein [Actinacidiphila sp. bgisy160]|uniref:hypothetical protein n=1 Tax=Actinacidiphila sp. bgisy160 TaxID=3413796 RepID=UPI003D756EBB